MPIIATISRWKPEQTLPVLQRFAEFLKRKDSSSTREYKSIKVN